MKKSQSQARKKKSIQFTHDVSLDPNGIECVSIDKSIKKVDLGLLSSLNTYDVNFDMNHELGDEVDIPPLQSPAVEIQQLDKIDGGHHVKLRVKCTESSGLDEQILFENSKNETLTLQITSRIMPNHMGTPALRSGIRLVYGAPDAMSDATDWQGFDVDNDND